MRSNGLVGIACVLLLAWPGLISAQTPSASLVGRIVDPSKAAVPEAVVQVRNTDTNERRRAVTSLNGEFTLPQLSPGPYEIEVEKPGFRTFRQTGLDLHAGQQARLDLELQVGAVAESVVVAATAPPLNTESGVKGDVIVSREIVEMPLEGRDYSDLAYLVPGVLPRAESGQGSYLAVNGARADSTNFLMDGFNNRTMRDGGPQARAPLEAVQEFRMEISGFSAEYGRFSGGVLNMVLKSGANRVSGNLFEFIRHEALDARNFFAAEKPENRQNQFGGSLGGPVWIPKVYRGRDRTFFYFSYEGRLDRGAEPRLSRVPTLLERQADFSKTFDRVGALIPIKDPLNPSACTLTNRAGCFPENRIPASRLDPIALKVLQYFPLPNIDSNINNYRANPEAGRTAHLAMVKIDHQITSRDRLTGRVLRRTNGWDAPYEAGDMAVFTTTKTEPQFMVGLSYTKMISPGWINELRTGLTRTVNTTLGDMHAVDATALLGIPGIPKDPILGGFPRFSITNLAPLGDSGSSPNKNTVNNYQWADTMTWSNGSHLIKFGVDILRTQLFRPYYVSNIRGIFYFQGRWATAPFADFLLGMLSSSNRQVGTSPAYLLTTTYGSFIQDNYKVTPRLTLDFGLRWDILKPPVEKYGRISNFVPDLGKIILASDKTLPNLPAMLAAANLTGKVGLAKEYNLPDALIRTSYRDFAPRFGFAWRPFSSNRMVFRGGYGIYYGTTDLLSIRNELANVYPLVVSQSFSRVSNNPYALVLSNPFPDALARISAVTNTKGYEVNAPTQYMQNWNFTIERGVGSAVVLEMTYSGSKGTHLGRKFNINQPYLPPGATTTVRTYTVFNTIDYFAFGSNSIYNAGMLTLRRRFDRGLFFRLNYVYGKSIDDASQISNYSAGGYDGAQSSKNLKGERGRSDWDIGHSFTMNFSYAVPKHRHKLLRNWQVAGTGRMYTGQPFTPRLSNTDVSLGEANRPDRIAKGYLEHRTPERWFDITAFKPVPPGSYRPGNCGRNILDGPGFIGLNSSLSKRFQVREYGSLQFRWEMFNLTNHPNFYMPARYVNDPNAGAISRAKAGRTMQFALRYQY